MNVSSLNYYAELLIELVRIVLICIYYNEYIKYMLTSCSRKVQNIFNKLKKSNTNNNNQNNNNNNNNNMDEQQQEENREEGNAALEQIVEEQRDIHALANRIHAFIEHAEAVMREMDEGDDSDILEESAEEEDDLMDIDDSDIDFLDEDGSSDEFEFEFTPIQNTEPYSCKPLKIQKCQYATEEIPCARSGHRVIADEANLYSLGGYNPRSDLGTETSLLFQELWQFNFATSCWHLIMEGETTTMPTELASNALIMHDNKLIAHGGTGFPFGELCSNDCYVYTLGSKPTVTCMKVTGERPTAQYGPGIVIHDGYLYTIGGTTGFDYSCDVYRLNLKTRVWERVYISRPEMRDDPEGRYRHEVVYDGSYIYVLGGGTSHSVYDLKRLPAFNLKLNRWDYIHTFPDRSAITRPRHDGYPRPRKCFSCVQHTNAQGDIEAFITGGLQVVLDNMGEDVPFQGDVRSYFGDIWRLNMRTKQWTSIRTASLPKPLYFHSAAHSGNGCMWIFGGIEYSLKDNHRRNYMFKMWMTIPRLSEMCWEAITYYNHRLNLYDRSTLLGAGLPDRFVQRIAALKDKPRQLVEPKLSTSV